MVVWDITEVYKVNQVRRDFIANTSHELRTPLTVLKGYLENMEKAVSSELDKWQGPILKMNKNTNRMIHIIDEMLFLAEIETEDTASSSESIDVPRLLYNIMEEAEGLSQNETGESLHQFVINIEQGLLLKGIEHEIYAAFSNLIFNAVKYTPAGKIEVTWREQDGRAVLDVMDKGPGIPQHHIPRLTERFYRVDAGRSREKGGTGLGLAIVNHVVNRHDAELKVESRVGQGSHFSIHFPVSRVYH